MSRYAFPVFVLLSAVAISLLVFSLTSSTTPSDLTIASPAPGELSARPRLHAILNGMCAGLLLVGFLFIRKRWIAAHVTMMMLATGTSILFLASYLDYHRQVGSMPFQGDGWIRPVYFSILLTHTILAALLPPLVAGLLWFAAQKHFDRHRQLARWTFPIWLYVSITGVLIYFMLYVLR